MNEFPEKSQHAPKANAANKTTQPKVSLVTGVDSQNRCAWVGQDPLYEKYHDTEWGVPVHDEQKLFEKICLEGFQAGLSWITILRKRDAFRDAFYDFELTKVASMTEDDVERLALNPSIIRHRGKIRATISNAKATITLDGKLPDIIWSFQPANNHAKPRPLTLDQCPSITVESEALSARLRKDGFRFVGPTTMYALMQSLGLVDDHVEGCHVVTNPT